MSTIKLNEQQLSDALVNYYDKYSQQFLNKKSAVYNINPAGTKMKGNIIFRTNPKEYSLSFSISNDSQAYTETIYLPVKLPLHDTINRLRHHHNKLVFLESPEEEVNAVFQTYEKLLSIYNEKKKEKSEHFSTLLDRENSLQKDDLKELKSLRENFDNETYFYEYILKHEQILNSGFKDNILMIGSLVKVGEELGIVKSINKMANVYEVKMASGELKETKLTNITLIPSNQEQIINEKKKHDILDIGLADLEEEDISVLIKVLDSISRDLVDDVNFMERPYITFKNAIDTSGEIVKVNIINPSFYLSKHLGHYYDSSETVLYIGSNLTKEERDLNDYPDSIINPISSYTDDEKPLEMFDFTFSSLSRFMMAAPFYNRIDLVHEKKNEADHQFVRFTKEYNGSDSLYRLSTPEVIEQLKSMPVKPHLDWNIEPENAHSIRSNMLIFALSNFFKQYPEARMKLTPTSGCKIVEKLENGDWRIATELMEVRGGYEPNILLDTKLKEKFNAGKFEEVVLLESSYLDYFLELDAFERRDDFLKLGEERFSPFVELFKSKGLNIKPNEKIIDELLYEYESDRIFRIVFAQVKKGVSLQAIIDKNPEFDKAKRITNFMYEFSTKYISKNKELIREVQENETKIQKERQDKLLEEQQKLVKNISDNYFYAVDIYPGSNSLYLAVIDAFSRQKKSPFNLGSKGNMSKQFTLSEKIDGRSYKIYGQAVTKLKTMVTNTIKANSDFGLTVENMDKPENIEKVLTIISRLFGANINLYYPESIVEIEYPDVKSTVPISGEEDFPYARAAIHLAFSPFSGKIFSLRPNLQLRNVTTYLLVPSNGVLLLEEDGDSQRYIGVWDEKERIIRSVDMPDMDGSIEIEEIVFSELNDRFYFEETEVLLIES